MKNIPTITLILTFLILTIFSPIKSSRILLNEKYDAETQSTSQYQIQGGGNFNITDDIAFGQGQAADQLQTTSNSPTFQPNPNTNFNTSQYQSQILQENVDDSNNTFNYMIEYQDEYNSTSEKVGSYDVNARENEIQFDLVEAVVENSQEDILYAEDFEEEEESVSIYKSVQTTNGEIIEERVAEVDNFQEQEQEGEIVVDVQSGSETFFQAQAQEQNETTVKQGSDPNDDIEAITSGQYQQQTQFANVAALDNGVDQININSDEFSAGSLDITLANKTLSYNTFQGQDNIAQINYNTTGS